MTRLLAPVALIFALALAGCGGYGSQNTPAGSTPAAADTAPTGTSMDSGTSQDPAEAASALCETMRDDIGALPSPKGNDDQVEYDTQLEGIEETYTNRLGMLSVSDPAKLAELVSAQQELFAAQADARSAANPEEGGEEGGQAQADARATVEKLAKDLGIESCASV